MSCKSTPNCGTCHIPPLTALVLHQQDEAVVGAVFLLGLLASLVVVGSDGSASKPGSCRVQAILGTISNHF